MTAPLRSTPHPSAITASQTAPVAEFRCLFTHDLRRKQKRWQDGFVKFHSFNKRVMLYDTSRNFLGDTYWKESDQLQEGDEFTLDKGVMVEVADALGVTQTDLTPLFEKKNDSPAAKSVAAPNALRMGSQLRHRSLNTLLKTQSGPIGKAMPVKSPFEIRQEKEKEKENEWAAERAAKRQKTVHTPLPKPKPREATLCTIGSEPDHVSSDTLSNTPSRTPCSTKPSAVATAPETPAGRTPRLPTGKIPLPHLKETPKPPPPPSSPPVSVSNRFSSRDFGPQFEKEYATETVKDSVKGTRKRPVKEPIQEPICVSVMESAKEPMKDTMRENVRNPGMEHDPRPRKTKSLRLATGTRRGVLLCQTLSQNQNRAPHGSSGRHSKGPRSWDQEGSVNTANESIILSSGNCSPSIRRGSTKPNIPENTSLYKDTRKPVCNQQRQAKRAKMAEHPPESSVDLFEDIELMHGHMDQQIYPPVSPRRNRSSRSISPTRHSPVRITSVNRNSLSQRQQSPRDMPPPTRPSKSGSHTRKRTNETDAAKSTVSSDAPMPKISTSGLDNPDTMSPRLLPARQTAYVAPLPDPAALAMASATCNAALSTGDFRKQGKRATSKEPSPQPATELSGSPPPPSKTKKKAPLMSTRELSTLLQQSRKPAHMRPDPTEDYSQARKTSSPNRAFQRSRSENDAPIPSMSETWEKQNLPTGHEPEPEPESVDAPPPAATTTTTKNPTGANKSKASKPPGSGLAALIKKTDPRRKLQRTRSLNLDAGADGEVEPDLPSPVLDPDVGPWSTEAGDLFDWRPPGREAGMVVVVE